MVRRKSIARSLSTRSSLSSRSEAASKVSRSPVKRPVQRIDRAYREIRLLQKTTRLIIPKAPFSRLVREVVAELFPRLGTFRMQVAALEALQEALEMYLVQFFEDSLLLTLHAKRVTLFPTDMRLLRRLRGRHDVGNR